MKFTTKIEVAIAALSATIVIALAAWATYTDPNESPRLRVAIMLVAYAMVFIGAKAYDYFPSRIEWWQMMRFKPAFCIGDKVLVIVISGSAPAPGKITQVYRTNTAGWASRPREVWRYRIAMDKTHKELTFDQSVDGFDRWNLPAWEIIHEKTGKRIKSFSNK